MMKGEKQGHIGNLQTMTMPQLLELLHRQEKLLAKPKFLHTMPDGGEKVKQFVKRLQQIIAQRQQQQNSDKGSQPGMSDVQISPAQQAPEDISVLQSNCLAEEDKAPVCSQESNAEGKGALQSQGDGTERLGDVEMTASLCTHLDALTVSEESSVSDGVHRQSTLTGDGQNLKIHFPNSYESVMKRNSSTPAKTSFKPHSSLKVREVKDLPDEYKFISRPGSSAGSRNQSVREVQEESAVRGPAYKFHGAKEISVEDSILLQKQQNEQLHSIQTLHATERLAERLNIKTMDYSPPVLDMNYRSSDPTDFGDDSDSDDEPDCDVLD